MKKINILLSGLLLCGLGLSSCDYDQEMPPVTYPEDGNIEEIGTGAWNDPYYVWQVLAGVQMEEINYSYAWVHGYVVGYIDTSKGAKLNGTTATFSKGSIASNILLAATPDEKDWTKCIPVQLEWGSDSRDLSLSANGGASLGKEVCIYGLTGNKYRTVYGVRNCDAYTYGSVGYPIASLENTYLKDGFGKFTMEYAIELPSGLPYLWKWDDGYGAVATGRNSDSGIRYATDSYLVSPFITVQPDQILTFDQAINYLSGNPREDFVEVCVRESEEGEWVVAEVDLWPAGNSWDFVRGCEVDLTEYKGRPIQIGFHYKSTTAVAPNWEIKNMYVLD